MSSIAMKVCTSQATRLLGGSCLPCARRVKFTHSSCFSFVRSFTVTSSARNSSQPPYDTSDAGSRFNASLHFADPSSPGSPYFPPSGAHIFHKLVNFLRAQYKLYGYKEVITPTIYKKSLWEKSGHWENYKDAMYSVVGRGASGSQDEALEPGQEEEFGLKPMNCPGHCMLFKKMSYSYRDLPLRFAEFAPLHRNEIASALTGLKRVRRFHQDDAHIFCRPSQIESEISATLSFLDSVYSVFNLPPWEFKLSTRPSTSYIGDLETWDRAEEALKAALDHSGRKWELNEGDGAFYGPKIDVILRDDLGRQQQTATIQLDFNLPQRFGLKYDPAPDESNDQPVMVHRALFGSVERFMALLMDYNNGWWPFWLSPNQVYIAVVSQSEDPDVEAYLDNVQQRLSGTFMQEIGSAVPLSRRTFNVKLDTGNKTLGKKIKLARAERYNYLVVMGKTEVEKGLLTLKNLKDDQVVLKDKTLEEVYQYLGETEDRYH